MLKPVLVVLALIVGLAPEKVNAVDVNVLVFIVPAATTLPAAFTLNLLVGLEPDCKSIRLPAALALVLLAKITALPLPGLPEVVTLRLLPVFVPLSKLNTVPDAALELLVKV